MGSQRRLPVFAPDRVLILSVLVALLVILGAGFVGPLSATPWLEVSQNTTPLLPESNSDDEPPEDRTPNASADIGSTVGEIATVLAFILALVLMAAVVRLVRSRRGQDNRGRGAYAVGAATVEENLPEHAAEQISRTLADAAASLSGPTDFPDAVLRCWLEVERATRLAGVPRLPHQTTSEFTSRVLESFNAPRPDVLSLQRLYQRVRFGTGNATRGVSAEEMAQAWIALSRIVDAVDAQLQPRAPR